MADPTLIERCRRALADRLPPRRLGDADDEDALDEGKLDQQALGAVEQEVLELLNQEVGHRLDAQHNLITQLDTKAGSLVAAGVAVAGYLLSRQQTPLTVLAIAADVLVVILGLSSLGVRSWQNAPSPTRLLQLETAGARVALDLVIRSKVTAFSRNGENMRAKSDWVKICTWCLAGALVLTSVAALA